MTRSIAAPRGFTHGARAVLLAGLAALVAALPAPADASFAAAGVAGIGADAEAAPAVEASKGSGGRAAAKPAPAPADPLSLPPEDRLDAAQELMLSDPAAALSVAQSVAEAPLSLDDRATALWLEAEALVRLNRAAEASGPAARGLALLGEDGDTKLRADLFLTQGRVARREGRVDEALTLYHAAHDLFAEIGETRSQAITLQSIGSIYNDAGAYERVLHYYERAAEAHDADPRLSMVARNNRGNALKALGRYDESLAMFAGALAVAEEQDSDYLRVRILTNIAAVEVQAGALDEAEATLARAMRITNRAGQDAWRDFVLGVRAELRVAQERPEAAVADVSRLFAGKDLAATPAPYREFHELAAALFAEREPGTALAHLRAFVRLDTAARDAAASANLALRAAEFDFTSQDLEIERLASAGLRSRLELAAAEQSRRDTQNAALILGLFALAAMSLAAVRFFRLKGETLRAMHAELAASHDELSATNEALVAANEARMRFLAATSHEIRTPLNGIIGMTEVVLRDMDMADDNRARVRIANEAGRALLVIVNDLLDMAKIEKDETEIVRTETDILALFEDTALLWQKAAEDKGIALRTSFYGCPDTAEIDEKHVRQIVNNLINNAIKFTESGEVRVSVSTEGQRFLVRVRDTGIGIAEEDQARVFEMFEQGQAGASRRYGGTGLGLAICRRLARLMGGEIALESAVGIGSTFTLSLPLADAGKAIQPSADLAVPSPEEAAPSAQATTGELPPLEGPPAPVDFSQLSVLVAEDNVVNQMVVKAYLGQRVREVVVANDGREALGLCETRVFDVVLMDKQMPNMDGVEATRAIRALGGPYAMTPIIAVTADAFQGAKDEMAAAGCQAFVAKPLSEEHLVETIEAVLARPEDSLRGGDAEAA